MKTLKTLLIIFLTCFLTFSVISCDDLEPKEDIECTIHMDDDNDNYCDICGKQIKEQCTIHMDDNNDGICDMCGTKLKEDDNTKTLNGYYTLTSKTVEKVNYDSAYLLNYLHFTSNNVELTTIDYSGSNTENGTYTINNNEVTLKFGIYEYTYTLNKETNTLSFDGTMNKKKVKMTYTLDSSFSKSTKTGAVNFTDALFGESMDENFYNYCPTMFMEDDHTMHIWYCGNKVSGNVTDYIMHRKGILTEDGKWTFTDKDIALEPGTGNDWDSRHTCDPSVVKGNFTYNSEEYHYLMAYLGCFTSDCTINMVGLAVSKTADGPWVKVGDEPFCDYEHSTEYSTDGNRWGYGQPSLVSVDKEGQVLLFYTKGIKLGTFTYCEKWDLSNLNNPVKLQETKLADGGAVETLNNADFAYDPVNNRIYVVKEDHPYPTNGGVDWISGSNTVYFVSGLSSDNCFADMLFRTHSWAKFGIVNKAGTGCERNHNSGILTDAYGWIINYEKIPVVFTSSMLKTDFPNWDKGGQWPALHTYRVHGFILSD